jgi:hypothetical protein
LNLDADLELARPRYSPTKAVQAAMVPHVERLARELLAPGDVLVGTADVRGMPGRAFCPTPLAIAALARAGAVPEEHPPVEVLRAVNSRAFCSDLGPTLPGAVFVRELDAALEVLARPPALARAWRVKRAFGMAGRGQRVVAAELDEGDRAFLRGAIDGGVQIEPNVAIVRELGVHGMIAKDRTFELGRLVTQTCDARGQWLATELAPDIGHPMMSEAERVAVALAERGYFGPFGIDGFEYRDLDGAVRLQPRSEINARYSMGFAVGFPKTA